MAKYAPTTTDNIDERQSDVPDVINQVESLLASLRCAESCETPADVDANLDEALAEIAAIKRAIDKLRKE